MKNENMLPEDVVCPYCKIELQLADDEQKSGKFICPNCSKEVTDVQNMLTKEDTKEIEKRTKKAMLYSVIPSIIIWLIIMTPIVLIYTTYIEPKEIKGSLEIPEWLVMPTVFLIIGLLVFIWKVLTNSIST